MYKFFRKVGDELIEESVELERWAWLVVYKDGTILRQFGKDNVFYQVGDIDQKNVLVFRMYRTDQEEVGLTLHIPEGTKIIHKYINFTLNAFTTKEKKVRVYMFGYKQNSSTFHYYYILPNNDIIYSKDKELELADYLNKYVVI